MKESTEAIIARYLSGEMSNDEKVSFESALKVDPALSKEFSLYKKIWEHIPAETASNWDTDSAWNKVSSKYAGGHRLDVVRTRRRVLWTIAASLLILAGAWFVLFRSGPAVTYAYDQVPGNVVELKDGSRITLNEGSEVVVSPFKRNRRHVLLQGEAFFEVTPDPKRPFSIASGQTLTEVVGTSFNIKQTASRITIFVESGKVLFSSTENVKEVAALTEGEAAVFENNHIELIQNPSPNVSAWRTQQLSFTHLMPLSTILEDVGEYFNQEIQIENKSIMDCQIRILRPFKDPKIRSVLEAIAVAVNAQLVVEEGKYILRGGRCS